MTLQEEVVYRTSDGDMLDDILWRWYGGADMLTAVLERNPGLAEQPFRLPAGVRIVLPVAEPPPAPAAVDLWT